jgi:hypothetical protein
MAAQTSILHVRKGALPAGLATDPDAYDKWFRAKVLEAMTDPRPAVPHEHVMDEAQTLIDKKASLQMTTSCAGGHHECQETIRAV